MFTARGIYIEQAIYARRRGACAAKIARAVWCAAETVCRGKPPRAWGAVFRRRATYTPRLTRDAAWGARARHAHSACSRMAKWCVCHDASLFFTGWCLLRARFFAFLLISSDGAFTLSRHASEARVRRWRCCRCPAWQRAIRGREKSCCLWFMFFLIWDKIWEQHGR